jgi:hypothetical protein
MLTGKNHSFASGYATTGCKDTIYAIYAACLSFVVQDYQNTGTNVNLNQFSFDFTINEF